MDRADRTTFHRASMKDEASYLCDSGKSLEAVIQQILSTEPKVTTINLNGFEG